MKQTCKLCDASGTNHLHIVNTWLCTRCAQEIIDAWHGRHQPTDDEIYVMMLEKFFELRQLPLFL